MFRLVEEVFVRVTTKDCVVLCIPFYVCRMKGTEQQQHREQRTETTTFI